jgi:hypothetical protein
MARADVVSEILSRMPRRLSQRWHDRVTGEHVATLEQIKSAYHEGRFGTRKKPACETIATWLRERGIADVGYQEILKWLGKTP